MTQYQIVSYPDGSTRHYYEAGPIDFWGCMLERADLCRVLVERGEGWEMEVEALQEVENAAIVQFRAMGWEGDLREGPFFFAVPMDGLCGYGIVYKQDNNGMCYISSPVPLPHLVTQ